LRLRVSSLWPALYMALLLVLAQIPGEAQPGDSALVRFFVWIPPDVQNLAHVPAYGLLALLWLRALADAPAALRTWAALLLTLGWGLINEWQQLYVPGRFASWTDAAANGLGAVLAWIWERWHRRR
jgi:hypothetical protein